MSMEVFLSSKGGDGFIEAARLIAGENPPQWLARLLRNWSFSVMLDGMVHAKQPGKAEARARLERLSAATESVRLELHDPVVVTPLLAGEFGPLPNSAGIDTVLAEIRRRAEVASARLDLLGTGLDIRLENLSDGAKLIARELQDPELSEFLRIEQIIGPPALTKELGGLLKEIRRQADAASYLPIWQTKPEKRKLDEVEPYFRSRARPRPFVPP